jgi:hypothetical protein
LYELFLFQVLIQKTFNREYMCCRLDGIFFSYIEFGHGDDKVEYLLFSLRGWRMAEHVRVDY